MITVRRAETWEEKRDAREVRRVVFVEEQGVHLKTKHDVCTDVYSDHYVAIDDGGMVVGTARGYGCEDALYKIERVALLRPWRGRGIGKKLMKCIEHVALEQAFRKTWLNAQLGALRFYFSVGYYPIGTPFLEESIVHIGMRKTLRNLEEAKERR